MSLVDDDAKTLVFQLTADGFQYVGELVDDGDDDFLAAAEVVAQCLGTVSPCHQVLQPLESNNVVLYLVVEVDAVGDDNDAIEQGLCSVEQADKLISEPSDGVGLARASRMLDQETLTYPVRLGLGEKLANAVELMVAGPNHTLFLDVGFGVEFLHHLGIVLDDVGK